MGVAGLGIRKDLTNEVHGAMYFESVPLFFPLHYYGGADHLRGGRNVEQERFTIGRRNLDWGLCQKPLDYVKCLLGLGHPFEMVGLL